MVVSPSERFEFLKRFDDGDRVCISYDVSVAEDMVGVDELVQLVLQANSAPTYLTAEVKAALVDFLDGRRYEQNAQSARVLLDQLTAEGIRDVADGVADLYCREVLAYAGPICASTEEMYADMFNQVIHSPSLESVLLVEQRGCAEVAALVDARDHQLLELSERQAELLQQAAASLSESRVNAVSAQHVEETELAESRWQSRIDAVKEEQRLKFWQWVSLAHERLQTGSSPPVLDQLQDSQSIPAEVSPTVAPSLEESFTVYLGTQLKHMYNIRLVATDILQLFRHASCAPTDQVQPRRIQTVVDLYSSSLSAAVLVVDDRVTTYTGLRRRFAALTDRSAELHFTPLQSQLADVRGVLAATSPELGGPRPGDAYLTRHSNLAGVHVAVHVVTSSSGDVSDAELSSRHPALRALRNVVRMALRRGLTSLYVPLLLCHRFGPHMTVAWCLRRAELVYKCVKGYLLEMASWIADGSGSPARGRSAGGADVGGQGGNGGSCVGSVTHQRTLQFILPEDVPEEVFVSLSSMVSTIFRLANPLVLNSA